MQPEIIVTGLKVADFPDDHLSNRGIFVHNRNWDRSTLEHADDLRLVERQEVEKMLSCHGPGQGFLHYACHSCGKTVVKSLGCNSRLCSRCGKPHADRWAASLKRRGGDSNSRGAEHHPLSRRAPYRAWLPLHGAARTVCRPAGGPGG